MASKSRMKLNNKTLIMGMIMLFVLYFLMVYAFLLNEEDLSSISSLAVLSGIWIPENSTLAIGALSFQISIILAIVDLISLWFFVLIVYIVAMLIKKKLDFLELYTILIWVEVVFQAFGLLITGYIIYFFIFLFFIFLYGMGIISFNK